MIPPDVFDAFAMVAAGMSAGALLMAAFLGHVFGGRCPGHVTWDDYRAAHPPWGDR